MRQYKVSFVRDGNTWFYVNVNAPNAKLAKQTAMQWFLSLHEYKLNVCAEVQKVA